MQIEENTVAYIEYELTNDEGEVMDSSKGRAPLGYVHGTGSLIPGLEAELAGKGPGDAFRVRVPCEQAYGERTEAMVQTVGRDQLPREVDVEVGMRFHAESQAGMHIVTVVGVEDDVVTLDANHPMAGIDLNFDVKVVDVRAATDDEIEHGHVHGPGGHEH